MILTWEHYKEIHKTGFSIMNMEYDIKNKSNEM